MPARRSEPCLAERTSAMPSEAAKRKPGCGPNLAVLYELACALDEFHGTDEQEPERPQRNQPHGIRPRGFKSRDVQLLVPLMPESGVAARRIDGA